MAKTKRIFQIFSAAEPINPNGEDPNRPTKHKSKNDNDMEHLAPTGIDFQSNEDKPQTSSKVEPLLPTSFQANDRADDFQQNLPRYKQICKKVLAADEIENNAEVEPMLPPVIS